MYPQSQRFEPARIVYYAMRVVGKIQHWNGRDLPSKGGANWTTLIGYLFYNNLLTSSVNMRLRMSGKMN